MLDGLAGVADRARRDPFFKISAAVANRAGRDFYKVWPAPAMPPILQGADGVTKDRRRFAFIDEGGWGMVHVVAFLPQ